MEDQTEQTVSDDYTPAEARLVAVGGDLAARLSVLTDTQDLSAPEVREARQSVDTAAQRSRTR
ncbi:hypothetical protein [Deinococcus sp. QL22]|uniref:hypothetical protein n=1 Tax=Deinococcus sp. QL22 TaxID=2939437 RepID=UPI0020181F77|nr:hypothetical protein [Deinococcus sp. QL22]UQN08822.1 hypothetical protein M1R55_19650 [Deinococcus sp. QL22]